tara:strand:+ start:653 stop:991 length:339 start_codon:yes stop_codon:yes gene_type:complete
MAKSKKVVRPEKKTDDELFKAIENALKNRSYYFTPHSQKRAQERRNVSELQVIRILKSKTKYHEKKKDEFKEEFNTWNYSIRGKTVDSENVRIAVSFDENNMLIVTVINLDE